MEDFDKLMAALGLKLVNLVVAAFSSFAALRFFNNMTVFDKWMTFMGGWAIAAWGGSPLREYLQLQPGVEIGIVLVLGLFGMAISAELIKLIRDTDWINILQTTILRKKPEDKSAPPPERKP